jgi:nitrite reductase (NADH) small subunit
VGNFVKVARRDEIPEGTGKTVEAGGKPIALFNSAGKFYAISNTCLHRGGPLGEGEFDGTTVTCPWHGWEYDLTTGSIAQDDTKKIACFAVRIEGDDVLVEV